MGPVYKPGELVVVAQEMVEAAVLLQGREPQFPDDVPVHVFTCRVLAARDDGKYDLMPVTWPAEGWAGSLRVEPHSILGLAPSAED